MAEYVLTATKNHARAGSFYDRIEGFYDLTFKLNGYGRSLDQYLEAHPLPVFPGALRNTPSKRHSSCLLACPKRANKRLMHRSYGDFHSIARTRATIVVDTRRDFAPKGDYVGNVCGDYATHTSVLLT